MTREQRKKLKKHKKDTAKEKERLEEKAKKQAAEKAKKQAKTMVGDMEHPAQSVQKGDKGMEQVEAASQGLDEGTVQILPAGAHQQPGRAQGQDHNREGYTWAR